MYSYFVLLCVFVGVSAFDLLLAFLSLRKKSAPGYIFSVCCFGSALVTGAYTASVFVENYFLYSVLSSIYFAGIDVTLGALLLFVGYFTQKGRLPKLRLGWKILTAYTVFDIAVLAVNPFCEIAIRYVYEQSEKPCYGYDMLPLYQLHLFLSYMYIAVILFYLVRKALKTPSVYRRQYMNCVWILALIVAINAVYLYSQSVGQKAALDYSLLGYSLAAFLFYWNNFIYSKEDMLNRLRGHIFANLDQGVLLFDYEDELILENERAVEMFSGTSWRQRPSLDELAELLGGAPEDLAGAGADRKDSRISFQCYPNMDQHIRPMRCDYSQLRSKRGELLGRMFVFSDLSMEYDVLTGFKEWDTYKRAEEALLREEGAEEETAVACDINGLGDINRTLGHMRGDQAIQTLAQRMREFFPEDTVFIRGREAILVALCRGLDDQQIEALLQRISDAFQNDQFGGKPLNFQSSVQRRKVSESREEAVRGAMEMLRTRKLLDQNSRHSSVLYSLVQALKECDKDTEEHVRRTQKLCARLGKRINLTEAQQSDLALLAILHDIGKIGIPLEILNKPGKLTEMEWETIKSHVEKGYQITSNTEELQGIADMVLYHHERWDGKGYPDGLSKETIPLLSRIIAVVDAYDAMVNDRAYRRAMPREQAMQELRRCAGTQFDPAIVREFLVMLTEEMGVKSDVSAGVKAQGDPEASGVGSDLPSGTGDDGAKEHAAQWSLEAPESFGQDAPRIHVMHFSHYFVDGKSRILEVDEAFEGMTGYSRGDVQELGLCQMDLIFEEDHEEYRRKISEVTTDQGTIWLEHRIRRKDGSPLFVHCYGRRYYDSAQRQRRTAITITDSAESYTVQTVVRMEQSKALRRLERWENKYRRDPLTGLLNHEAFKNDVETRLLSGRHQAMMLMMDVDHFKEYNDTYGHRAGDEFLIMVAQALLGTLRNDDFACRMGGDEFAAILFFPMDVTRERMEQRAGEICSKINLMLTSMPHGGASLSMGGAFLSETCNTFDRLYEAADQALYRSKEGGREQVSF